MLLTLNFLSRTPHLPIEKIKEFFIVIGTRKWVFESKNTTRDRPAGGF